MSAQLGGSWLTVVFILAILASLARAFYQIVHPPTALTAAERLVAALPISIHAGWGTVASLATTSTVLKASGLGSVDLSEQGWAVRTALCRSEGYWLADKLIRYDTAPPGR